MAARGRDQLRVRRGQEGEAIFGRRRRHPGREGDDARLLPRAPLARRSRLAGVGLLAVDPVPDPLRPCIPCTRSRRASPPSAPAKPVRLDAGLPQEIEPLQHELNALLKSNQEIVERARTHVGKPCPRPEDAAGRHRQTRARDDSTGLGAKVTEQAELMHTQVNLYLERAPHGGPHRRHRPRHRGRAGGGRSIVRALETHLSRAPAHLHGRLRSRPLASKAERQDLEEMLGNLLDNAAKWARTRVIVTANPLAPAPAGPVGNWLHIKVEDDGPGLTAEQLGAADHPRFAALDETKPGVGPWAIPLSPIWPIPTAASWSWSAQSWAAFRPN